MCLIRIHPGGEGRNRPSAPDPSSAGAAWTDPTTAPDPTGHHNGYHQQVCTHTDTHSGFSILKRFRLITALDNSHGGQKGEIKVSKQEQSLSIKT